MKKALIRTTILVIVLLTMLSVVGCGKEADSNTYGNKSDVDIATTKTNNEVEGYESSELENHVEPSNNQNTNTKTETFSDNKVFEERTTLSESKDQTDNVTSHTHKHNKLDTIASTCVEKGYTVYKCACGDTYKSDYKNALGHKAVSDKAVDSTCTKAGLTEGSHCSVCGTVIIAQKTISAKGHSWSKWTVTRDAGVGIKGEEKRSCASCGVTDTRSIPALAKENYKEFNKKIGIYHTDNVKYEYLKNHFDYSAYIQVYALNKSSSNESNIINEFKKHFGFTPTEKVVIEKVGTYLVNGKVETVYSYSIDDKTYPFMDHELYNVYHQICTDGKSHWVGFAIEGSANDDWGKLMSTPKVQALKKEMYKLFYQKTGCSAEYISSHDDDFAMGWISQAGTMRTSDGKLIDVLYIYCRELSK